MRTSEIHCVSDNPAMRDCSWKQVELDDEPEHGRNDQVQADDVAGPVRPMKTPEQQSKDEQLGTELIQLGRVQRYAERRAKHLVFASGLVDVTAHGLSVERSQQHPAEKHPNRPIAARARSLAPMHLR